MDVINDTYTQNWPRDIQIAVTQEAQYWANLTYPQFVAEWNTSTGMDNMSGTPTYDLQATGTLMMMQGAGVSMLDSPLPGPADIPGWAWAGIGLCVAAIGVVAAVGSRTITLPQRPSQDFDIVGASTVLTYSVPDYDALDRDHSIPKKFPNQRCSEKLRLQLQDEIDNQWCNQSRSCTDLGLSCRQIMARIVWNDLCYAAREMMKSRCFPTDPSHDAEIEVVRGVRDRCYQELYARC